MAFSFTSWNIEGRLSRYSKEGRGSPEHIVSEIKALDSDVIFLVDAYGQNPKIEPVIDDSFKAMGYETHDIAYNDVGARTRKDVFVLNQTLRLASRIPILNIYDIRLGNLRNGLVAHVVDPDTKTSVRIIGMHLEDRSEKLRLQQVNDLIPIINTSNVPTILAGDANEMDGSTLKAQLLRSKFSRAFAKAVSHTELGYFVFRTTDMATGTSLSSIESETDLTNINRHHRPTTTPKVYGHTWLPSIPLIDIDQAFVSSNIIASNLKIGTHDSGSDHRPVSFIVEL